MRATKNIYAVLFLFLCISFSSCGIYTFHDVSVPDGVKTVKIGFIENKATYVNPRLSSQLTDAFVQLVANQTKLNRKDDNDADYVINSTITSYSVSTSGISGNQASQNRLTVSVHMQLIDNFKKDTKQFDVSSDFDFAASLSLQEAENKLMPDILKNLSEAMFNKIFSNW
ncbi:LptE family protein [Arachidicoccus soli]|uniref:LptE family protein n=1 Tax=Arachidicoccus soli TaxID=2341117 RepID=UPI001F09C87D|nr:LptE family protein [Arachidicoccus soli]